MGTGRMKWLPPTGSTQASSCGRYVVVQANSQDWVAYDISSRTAAQDLGAAQSDADARELCESAERALLALSRRKVV